MKRPGKPSRLTVTYCAAWAAFYALFVVAVLHVHGWAPSLAVDAVYLVGYVAFCELRDRAADARRQTVVINVTAATTSSDIDQAAVGWALRRMS